MAGADKNGPTAVLNSAGKIPYMHSQLLNQRFMTQLAEGENKKLFAEYIREWHEKGTIPHVQFNVWDSGTLRDAQEHPEKYTDLQVRVARLQRLLDRSIQGDPGQHHRQDRTIHGLLVHPGG